jgi:DUF2924 family protein
VFGKWSRANPVRKVEVKFLATHSFFSSCSGLRFLRMDSHKRLQKLAADLEQDRKAPLLLTAQLKPGTKLLRQFQGEMYEVLVADEGFEYRGKRYESLAD